MRRAGVTYRDYSTPSSADVLVNAFRRYLGVTARKTKETGFAKAASVVEDDATSSPYHDDLPRELLLDRYQSHTKTCNICSAELKSCQEQLGRWETAQVALVGATGASTAAVVAALFTAARSGAFSVTPSSLWMTTATWMSTLFWIVGGC